MAARTARLFMNGNSQAVRLPADFRFEGSEVSIRRDPRTGEVILAGRPANADWASFFEARDLAVDEVCDFLIDRKNDLAQHRDF